MSQHDYQDERLTILGGDCLDRLRSLPAESVQCCVTSPPYFGLRDYQTAEWQGGDAACDHKNSASVPRGTSDSHSTDQQSRQGMLKPYRDVCGKCGACRIDRQVGLESTPEDFIAKLVEVFREVRRVLKNDGVLWVNIGDSYAGSGKGRNADGTHQEGGKQGTSRGTIEGEIFKTVVPRPQYRMRKDLTDEQVNYVLSELLKARAISDETQDARL